MRLPVTVRRTEEIAGNRQGGFTLFEAVIAIVIMGVIAAMVSVFVARPIQGYADTVRRAGLTDVADLALRRIGLDTRAAVPNSVRLRSASSAAASCSAPSGGNTACYLELAPARAGGRYCTDRDTGCNALLIGAGSTDVSFDVLGPTHDAATGEGVVIYNTGQSDLDVYAGNNRRTVAAGTTTTAITLSGASGFVYPSPSNRFQIVPSTGPITFACEGVGGGTDGTGSLNRYNGYGYNATQAASGLGTARLLADSISACNMSYAQINARSGVVSISLTVTRSGESVSLMSQIHVDNMP